MGSINYVIHGEHGGAVIFPDDVALHDASPFETDGLLFSVPELVEELNMARYMNRENIILALDYAQPVTPWQVMNALSILGWTYTLTEDLQTDLDLWEKEGNRPPEGAQT